MIHFLPGVGIGETDLVDKTFIPHFSIKSVLPSLNIQTWTLWVLYDVRGNLSVTTLWVKYHGYFFLFKKWKW